MTTVRVDEVAIDGTHAHGEGKSDGLYLGLHKSTPPQSRSERADGLEDHTVS